MHVCIYIYIEREREMYTYIYTHMNSPPSVEGSPWVVLCWAPPEEPFRKGFQAYSERDFHLIPRGISTLTGVRKVKWFIV